MPSIIGLRAHFEGLRQEVLSARDQDAETATHRLIQRLLHDPSEVLRASAADGGGEKLSLSEAAARLFRLQAEGDQGSGRKGGAAPKDDDEKEAKKKAKVIDEDMIPTSLEELKKLKEVQAKKAKQVDVDALFGGSPIRE